MTDNKSNPRSMRHVTNVTPDMNSETVLQLGPLAPLVGKWEVPKSVGDFMLPPPFLTDHH